MYNSELENFVQRQEQKRIYGGGEQSGLNSQTKTLNFKSTQVFNF